MTETDSSSRTKPTGGSGLRIRESGGRGARDRHREQAASISKTTKGGPRDRRDRPRRREGRKAHSSVPPPPLWENSLSLSAPPSSSASESTKPAHTSLLAIFARGYRRRHAHRERTRCDGRRSRCRRQAHRLRVRAVTPGQSTSAWRRPCSAAAGVLLFLLLRLRLRRRRHQRL